VDYVSGLFTRFNEIRFFLGCVFGLNYPLVFPLAMLLEVVVPKPGSVHRYGDLPDLRFTDFVVTSIASVPCFERGFKRGLRGWSSVVFGDLVYCGVKNMVSLTGVNTSLGSITLLAPLAVSTGRCFREGRVSLECVTDITDLINATSVQDTLYFYRAVRLAKPSLPKLEVGGKLVDVYARDYAEQIREKKLRLAEVLEYSKSVELVHRELLDNYKRSRSALTVLESMLEDKRDWVESAVIAHLYLLSSDVDTLIARKWGLERAVYVKEHAREIYEEALKGGDWWSKFWDFDRELRANRVNPGSTADLLCTTIALYLLKRVFQSEKPIP